MSVIFCLVVLRHFRHFCLVVMRHFRYFFHLVMFHFPHFCLVVMNHFRHRGRASFLSYFATWSCVISALFCPVFMPYSAIFCYVVKRHFCNFLPRGHALFRHFLPRGQASFQAPRKADITAIFALAEVAKLGKAFWCKFKKYLLLSAKMHCFKCKKLCSQCKKLWVEGNIHRYIYIYNI